MKSNLIPTKSCYVICLKYDDSLTLIHSRSFSCFSTPVSSVVVGLHFLVVLGGLVTLTLLIAFLHVSTFGGGSSLSWLLIRGSGVFSLSKGMLVSRAHAEPVSVESNDPGRDEQIPEQEGLPGGESVSESWGSEVDFFGLVP